MDILEGVRTLIVEDELLIALDIKFTLSQVGAQVVTTLFDVRDAFDLLAACSSAFDLVIFDINLRGRQSYPAIEVCLKLGKPAVIVSGNSSSQYRRIAGRLVGEWIKGSHAAPELAW